MSRVHRQDYEMARVEKTVKILVCNAGSSSLKFEAEDEALMAEGGIDWTTEPTLLLRCRRQREIREDLKLRKHADAAALILEVLQAGPSASLHGSKNSKEWAIARFTAAGVTPMPYGLCRRSMA